MLSHVWLCNPMNMSISFLRFPWAFQAPLSMEFSRQYWSGNPSHLQGFFLTQGSNLGLLHCRQTPYHKLKKIKEKERDLSLISKLVMLLLLLSRFSHVRLCVKPQMAAHQAAPCLGFSRQEQWSGLPFPSPMHESEKWKWSCSVVSDSNDPSLSWFHHRLPEQIISITLSTNTDTIPVGRAAHRYIYMLHFCLYVWSKLLGTLNN